MHYHLSVEECRYRQKSLGFILSLLLVSTTIKEKELNLRISLSILFRKYVQWPDVLIICSLLTQA